MEEWPPTGVDQIAMNQNQVYGIEQEPLTVPRKEDDTHTQAEMNQNGIEQVQETSPTVPRKEDEIAMNQNLVYGVAISEGGRS